LGIEERKDKKREEKKNKSLKNTPNLQSHYSLLYKKASTMMILMTPTKAIVRALKKSYMLL
jgi:hypothetical protein